MTFLGDLLPFFLLFLWPNSANLWILKDVSWERFILLLLIQTHYGEDIIDDIDFRFCI